jgi:hypothetical protein
MELTTGVVFLHKCIILDACCIINLYASRQFGHILEAIPASVAVATYIQVKEALKIYGGPAEDVMQKEEQIDLQPFIDRGLLLPVSPESEAENVIYVNFAASLDDGEAITGAIAVHRNWAIGSDDRRAISLFAKEAPQLQRISTLELMKHWVDSTGLPADVVRSALRNVRIRAKYEPHSRHPLYHWWRTYMES